MMKGSVFCLGMIVFCAAFIDSSSGAPPDAPEPKKPPIKPPLPPFPDDPPEPIVPANVEKGGKTNKALDMTAPSLEPPKALGIPTQTLPKYDVINVKPTRGLLPDAEQVVIGFFNHSDADVSLEINKRPVKLNSRYYLQLKLPREFTWRVKEGPLTTTKVPAEADGVEIVFRQ